jgi:hypothetical protein
MNENMKNILLIGTDEAKSYPELLQKYIETKGARCFLSRWKGNEIRDTISKNKLRPSGTIIHARAAGPPRNRDI